MLETNALQKLGHLRGVRLLFAVALFLRLGAMLASGFAHRVDHGAWGFGYEAACIADSLHAGHGFAGPWTRAEVPWNLGSGATAWLSPAYPGFVALLMNVFGGLVPGTAFALFFVQSIVGAFTCVAVVGLGRALNAERAGLVAGWVLAVFPAAVWNASAVVWDTTFVACAIVLFMWGAFVCARGSMRKWGWFGAGFGLLLMLNPAPLALLPAALLPAWLQRQSVRVFGRNVALFALMAFVVVLPWMLRNQRRLGSFSMRTNLGVELMVGNNDDANGRFQISHHPSNSGAEFVRYRELGEVKYAAWAMQEARGWIAEHPGRFVGLCVRRFVFFWIGEDPITDPRTDESGRRAITDVGTWIKFVAFALTGVLGVFGAVRWARRDLAGRVLLLAFFLFPLMYCVTHVLERYRFPIEPLLVLAAVWGILDLWERRRGRSLSSRSP